MMVVVDLFITMISWQSHSYNFFKEIPYIGIFIYEYNDFLYSVQFSCSVVSNSL